MNPSPSHRFFLAALCFALAAGCNNPPLDGTGDDGDVEQSAAALSYSGTSLFGIHSYPDSYQAPPDWLGGGTKKIWVTEQVATSNSYDWFHYNGYCYDNTTCGMLKRLSTRNTQLIARIDYNRNGQHYVVPPNGDWNALHDWKVLVRDRLFKSNDGTPISRYAPTILIGNEVNLCLENDMDPSCAQVAPAQKSIRYDWYGEVYRQMRAHIRAEAAAAGYPYVSVMLGAPSPFGYGGTRYLNYVLNFLCNDTVDSISIHAYGWLDSPGGDNTYGFSGQVAAQMRAIDEACNGKFRNVPVVITEFSRGDRPIADSNFIYNAYAWMNNTWNANANNHPIAGATYFLGRSDGGAFTYENITLDSPNSHVTSRAAFKQAVGNAWNARIGGAPTTAPSKTNTCSTGGTSVTYSQTGYTLSGAFNSFWNANGGLGAFGYPISNARMETNSSGFTVCTQWFERQRFELSSSGTVQLGLLGNERKGEDYQQINSQGAWARRTSAPTGCRFFSETGHTLCGEFKTYYETHGLQSGGSLALFGFPVTEEFTYTNASGQAVTAQYFERARLEFHPQNSSPYRVLQGRLGAELYRNER
ncbi:MAG TPA: hypothetical protein VK447_15945 [Myxococcaceae bacterium]|nr:hypothetical protein [Myxococcaceae bacterium]